MNKIISIRDLSVSYDQNIALSQVNLDIYDNDFLGVIGPNGGGKTSLIKAILGAVNYSGSIVYEDGFTGNIGYLPQQNNFDRSFPISVVNVVVSGLQAGKGLGHRYTKADYAMAKDLLQTVGIENIAGKQIGEISGGQMQRALLCRALISNPHLLILDEPANFVDNKFEKELYAILSKLNEKMAIIMVSHDIGTITSVVKNIVCVNNHVHRHHSNIITAEQLHNYDCPIQLVYHGQVPHTVLERH